MVKPIHAKIPRDEVKISARRFAEALLIFESDS